MGSFNCRRWSILIVAKVFSNCRWTLGRIARYLGVGVGEDALRRVAAEHALGEMKKRQPHHVFRGGWGGWLEYLNDRQVHTVQRIAGQMMKALGYPLKRVGNIGIITPFPPPSGPALVFIHKSGTVFRGLQAEL